jgi:hypothetical protein
MIGPFVITMVTTGPVFGNGRRNCRLVLPIGATQECHSQRERFRTRADGISFACAFECLAAKESVQLKRLLFSGDFRAATVLACSGR